MQVDRRVAEATAGGIEAGDVVRVSMGQQNRFDGRAEGGDVIEQDAASAAGPSVTTKQLVWYSPRAWARMSGGVSGMEAFPGSGAVGGVSGPRIVY